MYTWLKWCINAKGLRRHFTRASACDVTSSRRKTAKMRRKHTLKTRKLATTIFDFCIRLNICVSVKVNSILYD